MVRSLWIWLEILCCMKQGLKWWGTFLFSVYHKISLNRWKLKKINIGTLFIICQNWFRKWKTKKKWLGALRQEAITWAYVDPGLCCHMSSPGHSELMILVYCFIKENTPTFLSHLLFQWLPPISTALQWLFFHSSQPPTRTQRQWFWLCGTQHSGWCRCVGSAD